MSVPQLYPALVLPLTHSSCSPLETNVVSTSLWTYSGLYHTLQVLATHNTGDVQMTDRQGSGMLRLAFMPSQAVGSVHLDRQRQQFYLMTAAGVRKVETAIGDAVTNGYQALQQRHQKALRRRALVILCLIITSVVVAVFK